MRKLAYPLVALSLIACGSSSGEPIVAGNGIGGGSPSAGRAATGGDAPAAGGAGVGFPTGCDLPVAGAAGQPRPAGATGPLTILDWAGFRGAVSYTFDDANSSQIGHYPELAGTGVRMTFYLQTGKSDAADEIWAQAVQDGHELGNHTKSHARTADEADIDAATEFIQTHFGVLPATMAAPYGDSSYVAPASSRFLINRGVSNAVIAPNGSSNPFDLPCYVPPSGAAASAFDAQIDAAREAGGWRVVLVHGFTGGSDGAYQPVDIEAFVAGVEHAKSFGDLWLDTVAAVGAYWRAQKLVSAVEPTTSGGEQTWSWSLPEHFPPGQCLRVTTGGGTLTQGGEPVEWDDHGYYELSLDAGSVTLAP